MLLPLYAAGHIRGAESGRMFGYALKNNKFVSGGIH